MYQKFCSTWRQMVYRCYNTDRPQYKHYGGRGIRVCKRWLSYNNFEEDMYLDFVKRIESLGMDRKMTSLERIDNDGDYSKKNCRWATMKEQSANKTRLRKRKIAIIGKIPNYNTVSIHIPYIP